MERIGPTISTQAASLRSTSLVANCSASSEEPSVVKITRASNISVPPEPSSSPHECNIGQKFCEVSSSLSAQGVRTLVPLTTFAWHSLVSKVNRHSTSNGFETLAETQSSALESFPKP